MVRSGSLAGDAELLAAVLERIAPGPVTLVGGSAGANLATLVAAFAPEH